MSGIFKAYDIRGKYPYEINKEIAFKIGKAFGGLIKENKIVVGMDARKSSDEIKDGILSGLYQTGKEIIDIGFSTTPMFYFAVNKLKADGGIMITASHLGAEFNGIKAVRKNAVPLVYDTGISKIEEGVKEMDYKYADYSVNKIDIKEDFVQFMASKKINYNGKIVVDPGNGMVGLFIKDFLEKMNINYETIYSEVDCTFPNHEANPIKESNLQKLKEFVLKQKADFGVAFDGDGDRIGFVDEKGNFVTSEIILSIIAKNVLKKEKGKILYNLTVSKIVPETILKFGGVPIKSRVGHSFIQKRMREEDVIFGGESSGHFYFKDCFYAESTLKALVNLLEVLSNSGKKLSEVVKPFKKYYKIIETNYEVKDKEGKISEIEKYYSKTDAKIEKIDGMTVEFENWWFNLRPSNTEDLLRLNLEGKTKEIMEDKLKEVESLIKE